jgi:hypothetical protein
VHQIAFEHVAFAKHSEWTFWRSYISSANASVYQKSGVGCLGLSVRGWCGQRRHMDIFPRRTSVVLARKARAIAHPESSRQAIFTTPSHQIREHARFKNTTEQAIAGGKQVAGDQTVVKVLFLLTQTGTATNATSTTTSESSAKCTGNHTFWVRDGRRGVEGAERSVIFFGLRSNG